MAKKRKASTPKSQAPERKPKVEPEPVKPEEEEEEESSEEEEEEETSSEEEEQEEEEEEDGSDSDSEAESGAESSSEEEPSDETLNRDAVRKLLEPFAKDQIIDFFKEAASKDSSLLDLVMQLVDSDPIHRKIFVHGLGWDATADQLLSVFKSFGEIEECRLITDKVTGRAKGYAFVLFKTRAAAKKALKQPQKKIGHRNVSCQLASLGPAAADSGNRKIYVGNVGPNVNAQKLRTYFAEFGEIEEGPLGFDPVTNKSKGFAIFIYKSAEACKKVLQEPQKAFDGCQLYCKKYVENQNASHTSAVSNVNSQVPQQDINYGSLGFNPALFGQNLNASGLLMGQNSGMAFAGNPMLAANFTQTGFAAPAYSGAMAANYGMNNMSTMAADYGVNAISPSVIGSYAPAAALQGLGAYQSAQVGQLSAGATASTAAGGGTAKPLGVSSPVTKKPSYLGR